MAYININEIDKTKIQTNSFVNVEAVVLVPGIATKGPTLVPSLLQNSEEEPPIYGKLTRSVSEFVDTWGDKPSSIAPMAWIYAYGIVKSGLPVYFVRVGETTPESATYVTEGETGPIVIDIESTEQGSYGDRLSVMIKLSYSKISASSLVTVMVDTYLADKPGTTNKGTRIESLAFTLPKSALAPAKDNADDSFAKLLASQLTKLESKYIIINSVALSFTSVFSSIAPDDSDPLSKRLELLSAYLVANANYTLSGGTDGITTTSTTQGVNGLGATDVVGKITTILSADNFYSQFNDKYKYDIMIVTAGGYSSKSIDARMIDLCTRRGDCDCVCDIPFGTSSAGTEAYLSDDIYTYTTYASATAPWIQTYSPYDSITPAWMPPSYMTLTKLGSASKNYPIWYPHAGVKRASLSNIIKPQYEIGETLMDRWQNQDIGINPIMKLRKYGYVIYGQRTTVRSPSEGVRTALESLNVRRISSYIKKYIFEICLSLSFDYNNRRLWNEFKAKLDPYLSEMKLNEGLYDYLIVMDETVVDSRAIAELKVPGYVIVSPNRSAERFEIGFVLTQVGVEFNQTSTGIDITPTYDSVSSPYEIKPGSITE